MSEFGDNIWDELLDDLGDGFAVTKSQHGEPFFIRDELERPDD